VRHLPNKPLARSLTFLLLRNDSSWAHFPPPSFPLEKAGMGTYVEKWRTYYGFSTQSNRCDLLAFTLGTLQWRTIANLNSTVVIGSPTTYDSTAGVQPGYRHDGTAPPF